MDSDPLTQRVEIVEFAIQGLDKLPPRVEALEARMTAFEGQILHLGTEMHDEFSAVRQELATAVGTLRGEIADAVGTLRGEIADAVGTLRGEIADAVGTLRGEIADAVVMLRGEIADSRNQALILHEEVLARITLLGEQFDRRPSHRTRKKR